MFLRDGNLYYVYKFLGLAPEHRLTANAPSSRRCFFGVEFEREAIGAHHKAHGTAKLHIDCQVVASERIRT